MDSVTVASWMSLPAIRGGAAGRGRRRWGGVEQMGGKQGNVATGFELQGAAGVFHLQAGEPGDGGALQADVGAAAGVRLGQAFCPDIAAGAGDQGLVGCDGAAEVVEVGASRQRKLFAADAAGEVVDVFGRD
ncbi:MAG: hypothetical protein IPO00_17830 [Betaproteobacteria bacterium]|nr:hypothetical protein [Betaproteobacteria bacterium]